MDEEPKDAEEYALAPDYRLTRRFSAGPLPMERWELWCGDELLAYFPAWVQTDLAWEMAAEIVRYHRARTHPPS